MTASIGPLPPKHLSQRAFWWLTQCTAIMPYEYPDDMPHGIAACLYARAQTNGPIVLKGKGKVSVPMIAATQAEMGEAGLTRLIKGWACTVPDVRAMYLNSPLVNDQLMVIQATPRAEADKQTGKFVWSLVELSMPTCAECMALLDKALGSAVPKYGDYPTAIDKHAMLTGWKKLEPPKVTTKPEITVVNEKLEVIK